jgi:PAS domain S-box-containing protein
MQHKQKATGPSAELRKRAEGRTRKSGTKAVQSGSTADVGSLLHELEVHQIELEMQNAELREARDEIDSSLEKYTDLYDFAPVGYFSIDRKGLILEVNLTGAGLLGLDRSQIVNRPLERFVAAASQPTFLTFLEQAFASSNSLACEVSLKRGSKATFWADLRAAPAAFLRQSQKWCRVAVSDITALKRAEEAQHRMEALNATNRELEIEIARRRTVEAALKKSEQHSNQLLSESLKLQQRLRHLSHQIIQVQEEERKRISRELHDEIVQTLVGITVQLSSLKVPGASRKHLQKLERTQRLVENSVNLVRRFARELRPTVLDDVGLIPALHSYMNDFMKRTGIQVRFTTFAGVEQLSNERRTVLYRVAQSALTNVSQHAEASRVDVSINRFENVVRMEIHDDGKSFDVEIVMVAKKNQRLGLLGMRERVEMVGGIFSVHSVPGKGTTIRVEIPFDNIRDQGKAG